MSNENIDTSREIRIVDEFEVAKIFAFARAGVRKIRFRMASEKVDTLLHHAEEFAHAHDIKISVSIIEPSGTRVLTYGLAGAATGATVGFLFGGLGGAVIGGGIGTVAGIAVAHVNIRIHFDEHGPDAVVALA
jgi:hypothetical protein